MFRSNLIYNDGGRDVIAVHDDVSGIDFRGNVLSGVDDPLLEAGFVNTALELMRAHNGLLFPVDERHAGIGASRDIEVLDRSGTGVSWYPKPDPAPFGKTVATPPAWIRCSKRQGTPTPAT